MNTNKIHSISKNLTISLVAVIVIISVIFFSVYYYQLTKNQRTRLENTADEYIHSIAKTLEVPLWDLDRENIKTVCNYYSQYDFVIMLKLLGVSGEVMCYKYMEPKVNEASLIRRSKDITHNGELIGSVSIVLSPFLSREINLEFLKVSIAVLLILVAGLIAFTGFLLKKFLKEPMDFLDGIARSYSNGDYNPQLGGNSYREFESFVAVLVDMGGKIESQLSELQKTDRLLKKHRDHLEEMVIMRTRELEDSNRELQNEIQYRKHAQEALMANEHRLEAILKASPVGIGLVINRRLGWANETMYSMLGYEKDSLMGMSVEILYKDHKEYKRVGRDIYNSIAQSEIGQVETQWVRKDGTVFECVIRACFLDAADPSKGQIVALSDISDAKRLEKKLQRAEKMEAIGTLAGGVAHDLNNILSGIVSYPELILMDIPEKSPLRKPLLTIQKSGEKAAEIVQDLLTMARRGVPVTEVINMNHIISEESNLL